MRRSGALLGMAVMAVTLASCSSGSSGTATTVQPTSGSPTTTVPKIGTALVAHDGSIVQTSFYGPDPGNGSIAPTSGKSLVSVTIYGCSPKHGSASFNPKYFTLKMKNNTTASAALGAVTGQIVSTKLSSGQCAIGKVGFEVAPGQTPVTLIFSPPNSSGRLHWSTGVATG